MTLDKISSTKSKKKVYGCETCGLSQNKFKNEGNLDAEILIVRDFPSEVDIRFKNYFGTIDGKYLKQALTKAEIDISNCYFTYTLLCNLPKIPNNLPIDSVKSCGTNLISLISQMPNLKLIIPMGDYSFKFFLNKSQLKKYRGELFRKNDLNIFPMYDPKYIMVNKPEEAKFFNDLVKARKILNNEISAGKDIEFLLCKTVEDLEYTKRTLETAEYYAFDIETIGVEYGLDAFSPHNKIMTIGFTTDSMESFCIPIDHPESELKDRSLTIEYIKNILNNNSKRIAHHAKFDVKNITTLLGLPITTVYADTMLASSVLNQGNGNSNSLKRLSVELLGYAENYSVMESGVENDKISLIDLAKYNCEDTVNAVLIYEILMSRLKDENLYDLFFDIVMKGNEALTEVELNGAKIDIEYGKSLLKKYEKCKEEVLTKLLSYPETTEIEEFNIKSSDHIGKLLYDKFKLKCHKLTASGKRSADIDALVVLTDEHPFVADLLLYKKYEKCISTYVMPLTEDHLKNDGKIHCGYHQDTTATGRLSAVSPNLQNIPSRGELGKEIKKMFIPSNNGWYILQADYSQVELRISAIETLDKTMIAAYKEFGDLHVTTAKEVLGKSTITKEDRNKAKPVNFGLIYLQSAKGFVKYAKKSYGITFTLSEAESIIKKFFNTYRGLTPWHNKTIQFVKKYGYAINLFGRKRLIANINSTDGYTRGAAERQSVNFPIQSVPAEMMVLSLYYVNKFLKDKGMKSKIINTVHDSMILECPPEELQTTARIVKTIMENIPTPFEKIIPIVADLEYGFNWGELESFKF